MSSEEVEVLSRASMYVLYVCPYVCYYPTVDCVWVRAQNPIQPLPCLDGDDVERPRSQGLTSPLTWPALPCRPQLIRSKMVSSSRCSWALGVFFLTRETGDGWWGEGTGTGEYNILGGGRTTTTTNSHHQEKFSSLEPQLGHEPSSSSLTSSSSSSAKRHILAQCERARERGNNNLDLESEFRRERLMLLCYYIDLMVCMLCCAAPALPTERST